MTKEEIRQVVNECLNELEKRRIIKDMRAVVYEEMNGRLFSYYQGGATDPNVTAAIDSLDGDLYLGILPYYFRDRFTIEQIAELMGVDVSTIVRNKKRLCISLYIELSRD